MDTLSGFDPEAPLAGAPDPWDYLPMPAIRPGPPWAMAEMIAAEPALVARIGARVTADGSAARLAEAVRTAALAREPVVVTGCGTSEHAAQAVAEVLREAWRAAALAGRGPEAAQAFELSLDAPDRGLVIGVSHEGGTAATIAALEAARSGGALTALITASAGAPAAAGADVVVATVEMDRSWCHTVGYVSPIAAAAVVATRLVGGSLEPERLRARVAEGIESALAARPGNSRANTAIGSAIAEARHLLVVGSGADRVTARELTLKVEEASYLPSAMRDLETFLHGHLPATGSETALLLVLLEREGLAKRVLRTRQALAAAGAVGIRAAAILGAEAAQAIPADLTPAGRIVVPEAPDLPDATAALLGAAGPLQLVTLAIAAARATNPDQIRRDDPAYLRAAELADAPDA